VEVLWVEAGLRVRLGPAAIELVDLLIDDVGDVD
jgi:hypothetical protein